MCLDGLKKLLLSTMCLIIPAKINFFNVGTLRGGASLVYYYHSIQLTYFITDISLFVHVLYAFHTISAELVAEIFFKNRQDLNRKPPGCCESALPLDHVEVNCQC